MVLRATLALTRNIRDAEKAYALACFNVLAHNRDDHVKNFSFLLNARNEWIFAPAYDLVFSYGPGGEQSMLVMGEGRNPGTAQLQALGCLLYTSCFGIGELDILPGMNAGEDVK